MNRQLLFRVLLSIVLLFSQQMATAHALEHLTAAIVIADEAHAQASAGLDEASELAKAVAQHQNCHQCLAFAQLAGPLASSARSFAPLELERYAGIGRAPASRPGAVAVAPQPRGPPRC